MDLNCLDIENLQERKDKLKDLFKKMKLERLKMHRFNDEGTSDSNENKGFILIINFGLLTLIR